MWEDRANLYDKLEDNTQMLRSLRASFFLKGGGNVIAPAATLLYGYYTGLVQALG